ncbi:MAG: RluA family pseudouridine synthase [Elusimicrobia bacterium]|nr:RluA family pseudouridine synthase [Elusimicrobiota bacterium]
MEKELTAIPGARIDSFLAANYPDFSRNYFKQLIKEKAVLINSRATEPSYKLRENDKVSIIFPATTKTDFSKCPLEIIYEDDSFIAINKPFGISAHPVFGRSGRAVKIQEPTISDIISAQRNNSKIDRSGLVHRLDKDTSGLMIIAKTPAAQYNIMKQFMHRSVEKIYLALVHGIFIEKNGSIDAPLARDFRDRKKFTIGFGRTAMTHFKVKEAFKDNTFLEVHPLTGRTHQIRVHLNSIGRSILGDKVYYSFESKNESEKLNISRQMLHAWKLTIMHPKTKKEIQLSAKLPADFSKALKLLKKSAAIALCIFSLALFSNISVVAATTAKKKTASPAPAGNKKLKSLEIQIIQLSDDLANVEDSFKVLSDNQQKLYDDQADSKNRVRETNLAVIELNRKLTELQAQFDQFKTDFKMQKVTGQDKKNAEQTRESNNPQPALTQDTADKLAGLQTAVELLKKELSSIQERMGIAKAQTTLEPENANRDKIKKMLTSPWAGAVALGVSILTLLIVIIPIIAN